MEMKRNLKFALDEARGDRARQVNLRRATQRRDRIYDYGKI